MVGVSGISMTEKISDWDLMKKGDSVTFLSCSTFQIQWGNNDDPYPILEEGKIYTVEDVRIHSLHTKIKLIGYDGWYNSVCFIRNEL
jgi:hypothetical protein